MRSFEFVDGSSAKFWEIDQDGTEVTVRWGRVGTTGQTKVKTFDSVAEAETHEAKLITEKTRKGYGETTPATATPSPSRTPAPAPATPSRHTASGSAAGPASGVSGSETASGPGVSGAEPGSGPGASSVASGQVASGSAASGPAVSSVASEAGASVPDEAVVDEDIFVLPVAWHRHRQVRRGSSDVGPFVPNPKARSLADEYVNRREGYITNTLEAPGADPAVAPAAISWRKGDPQASPLGAAAVAKAAMLGNWDIHDKMVVLADLWIAERGLRFAAEAATELLGLTFDDHPASGGRSSREQWFGLRRKRAGEAHSHSHSPQSDPEVRIALRVRAALAAASEAEHAEVVEALTPYRSLGVYQRAMTSLLVPDRAEWVAEDIDAALADHDQWRAALLLHAAGTEAQATALAGIVSGYAVTGTLTTLTTMC